MQLTGAVKRWFGFDAAANPFSDTPDDAAAIYRWPEFDEAVEKIVHAVIGHRYLVVCGGYASSKSTAWMCARERLESEPKWNVLIGEPAGLDPRAYDEGTIYRAIVSGIGDGQSMRRARSERADQCRDILAEHYDRSGPDRKCRSAVVVNDAHCCRRDFLLMTKRLWDQLNGYARVCAVVLVGQAPLHAAVEREGEIAARREIVILPGLGGHVGDFVAHECRRCGVEATTVMSTTAIEALAALRSDKRFDTSDHPLRVSNVVNRALRIAHSIRQKQVDADTIGHAMRTGDEDTGGVSRRGARLAVVHE